jgi:hypothetical protein
VLCAVQGWSPIPKARSIIQGDYGKCQIVDQRVIHSAHPTLTKQARLCYYLKTTLNKHFLVDIGGTITCLESLTWKGKVYMLNMAFEKHCSGTHKWIIFGHTRWKTYMKWPWKVNQATTQWLVNKWVILLCFTLFSGIHSGGGGVFGVYQSKLSKLYCPFT